MTRAERLLAERAVPARRVEDARRAIDGRRSAAARRGSPARAARRDARSGGGAAAGNAFVLRAPIAGRIVEVHGDAGRVVRRRRAALQDRAHRCASSSARTCRRPMRRGARRLTAVALEIRAVPIRCRCKPNTSTTPASSTRRPALAGADRGRRIPAAQLLIGQAARPCSTQPARERLPAVPKAAVLMEAGRPYVFVQIGGERFARRCIEIAARDGDWIGVKSGVKPGDRVVDPRRLRSAAGVGGEGLAGRRPRALG